MDQHAADKLYRWLATAIRKAMSSHRSSTDKRSEGQFTGRILSVGPEILSRLLFRASPESIQDAFNLAVAMHASEASVAGMDRTGALDVMWRGLTAASAEQIRTWLPNLLDLPAPDDEWAADPFPHLAAKLAKASTATEEERQSWSPRIDTLIRLMRDGSPRVRQYASIRLYWLFRLQALNAEQATALERALWGATGSTGLPRHTDLLPSALLRLPTPDAVNIHDVITEHFLAGTRTDSNHFRGILNATQMHWSPPEERSECISWTAEQSARMLSRIEETWQDRQTWLDLHDEISRPADWQTVHVFVDVIATVVMPNLSTADADSEGSPWRTIRKLLDELDQEGLASMPARPLLLLVQANDRLVQETAEQVRRALHSSRADDVHGAATAISYWLAYAHLTRRLPPPPPYLLDELISHAVSRRQPSLAFVLDALVELLSHVPQCLEDAHIQELRRCLLYMHDDLGQPSQRDDARSMAPDGTDEPLVRHERLALHWHAARLAGHLAQHCLTARQPVFAEVENWRALGLISPLPEVRDIWAELSDSPSPATRPN